MNKSQKIKVLSAVTVSESVIFFYGMPRYLSEYGYEIAISAKAGPELDKIHAEEKVRIFKVDMEREVSIFKDLVSLGGVLKVLSFYKPDIVNTGTPKAGLLYLMGAWLKRVPIRIYHVRGLRHESLSGFSEKLQIIIERLCGFLATHIVCETKSLEELALEQALYPVSKCHVLGPGSSGVELENYNPKHYSNESRQKFRGELGIPQDAVVIGFLGRVVPRKGIAELIDAWTTLREKHPDAYLLIAGPLESAQPVSSEVLGVIRDDPRVIFTGRVNNAAKYYSVMDVFTLPAHWEGFGNVLVEAAAMGLPVVTTDGTGTRDAAKDNFNAKVIPVKDSKALQNALSLYLSDPQKRYIDGQNGMEWALNFERKVILGHLLSFYEKLVKDNCLR